MNMEEEFRAKVKSAAEAMPLDQWKKCNELRIRPAGQYSGNQNFETETTKGLVLTIVDSSDEFQNAMAMYWELFADDIPVAKYQIYLRYDETRGTHSGEKWVQDLHDEVVKNYKLQLDAQKIDIMNKIN